MERTCKLELDEVQVLEGLRIFTTFGDTPTYLSGALLKFRALVEPTRIPCHIAVQSCSSVQFLYKDVHDWFIALLGRNVPLDGGGKQPASVPWFDTDCVESPIGILTQVVPTPGKTLEKSHPRVSEVLFFGRSKRIPSFDRESSDQPPRDENLDPDRAAPFSILALPLSADLLYSDSAISGPLAQCKDNPGSAATVLCAPLEYSDQADHDRLGELFDKASDRRKKARRACGQQPVAATSRTVSSPQLLQTPISDGVAIKAEHACARPMLNRRKESPTSLTPVQVPSPALGDQLAPTSHQSASDKRSSSSRISSAAGIENSGFEARNKQLVSRAVLTGMRMYGLQQRKSTSTAQSTTIDSLLHVDEDTQASAAAGPGERDGEFKSVYHQTYKGTVFALRGSLESCLIQPDDIREVVDRLLAIFCNEPP